MKPTKRTFALASAALLTCSIIGVTAAPANAITLPTIPIVTPAVNNTVLPILQTVTNAVNNTVQPVTQTVNNTLSVISDLLGPSTVGLTDLGSNTLKVSYNPVINALHPVLNYTVQIVDQTGTVVQEGTLPASATEVVSTTLGAGTYTAKVVANALDGISLPSVSIPITLSALNNTTTPVNIPVVPLPPAPVDPTTTTNTNTTNNPTGTNTSTSTTTSTSTSTTTGTDTSSDANTKGNNGSSTTTDTTSTNTATNPSPQPSQNTTSTTAAAPDMDSSVGTIVRSNSSMDISWKAPTGATAGTWYQITLISAHDKKVFKTSSLQVKATNLMPESYKVSVSACTGSACGAKESIASVSSIVLPGKVATPKVKKISSHSAVIKWVRPSARGGSAVKWYNVKVQVFKGHTWKTTRTVHVKSKTSVVVKKLKAHTRYRVSVAALNSNAITHTTALQGKMSKVKAFKTK